MMGKAVGWVLLASYLGWIVAGGVGVFFGLLAVTAGAAVYGATKK